MNIKRVHIKHGRYYYVEALADRNPRTGRPIKKWTQLTRVGDGEPALLKALAALLDPPKKREGNMKALLADFKSDHLPDLTPGVKKEYERMYAIVGEAFVEFDADKVNPSDVLTFLNNNFSEHRTARRHYKARISTFYSWCVVNKEKTGVTVNPCRELKLKAPTKRKAKMNAAAFWKINAALSPIGKCFEELMFLTTARPTEIRLLRESAIVDGVIKFTPSKTEDSSGATVDWPITPQISAVLDRARALQKVKALRGGDAYVIQTADGTAFTKSGMNSLWRVARKKAGHPEVTTRDVRPFALTFAEKMLGHPLEDLRKAAAHTTTSTTEGYLDQYRQVISPVHMVLPEKR